MRRKLPCSGCANSLKANGAISFTVGNKGRHTAPANFLGGRITLATGPLAMGRTTGAAVLPVSTLRLAPGKFEVAIGAPIEVPKDADGKPDYAAAVQTYADWVTPFVLRDPGQWRGWRYTSLAQPELSGRLPRSIGNRAVREGIAVVPRQRITPAPRRVALRCHALRRRKRTGIRLRPRLSPSPAEKDVRAP